MPNASGSNSSIDYLWGSGLSRDPLLRSLGALGLDIHEPLIEQIEDLINRFSFRITQLIAKNGITINSITPSISSNETSEEYIRELLKDHHGTFSLFELSIKEACKTGTIGTNTSINLYIQDISNPRFIKVLENAKKNGLNPSLLNLEIYPDNYGIANQTVTDNLRTISNLGFRFSVILDEESLLGEEKGTNLEKIVDKGLDPVYVKIAKSVLYKIKTGKLEVSMNLRDILSRFESKGFFHFVKQTNKERIRGKEMEKPFLPFLAESTIQEEGMLNLDGELCAEEYLIRFGSGISVMQGLERLKMLDMTDDLMYRMLVPAIKAVKSGKVISTNFFLKNLGRPDFCERIMELTRGIERGKRKGLIFEVLEEKYGCISPLLIANIRFLQEQGFAIAIDDLYLGDNARGISKTILESFIVESIIPDYIKIDGRHMAEIQELQGIEAELIELHTSLNAPRGEIEQRNIRLRLLRNRISHLKEIIGQFSVEEKKSVFILEWIQDYDHALQVHQILHHPDSIFLYQGRDINTSNFSPVNSKNTK